MLPIRQLLAYLGTTALALCFIFYHDNDHVRVPWSSLTNNRIPDFSRYEDLKILSAAEFPLDHPEKRVIIVGDIHGMHGSLRTLLDKLSYDPTSDVLVHVGDIIVRGPYDGSMGVLSFMTSNNITGVRGNHDQKVIEWRGWIDWIRNQREGKKWLDHTHQRWTEAEAGGADPDIWVKLERERNPNGWWKKVPHGWTLFADHYKIAHGMSDAHYAYLVSLPLKLYIPSAHTFVVHAGLLPSDPRYPYNHPRQPLARVPTLPSVLRSHRSAPKNDTIKILRHRQELALLTQVPHNRDPWTILNMKSILDGRAIKHKKGTSWSNLWKRDMTRCEGFDHDLLLKKHKTGALPCYPSTVVYGHAASRGLDIKRWSVGLEAGCVYRRQLTALVLGPNPLTPSRSIHDNDGNEIDFETSHTIPYGDNGKGVIVGVRCD